MKDKVLEVQFPYNPLRDLNPVDQVGFVDLRDAYVNHSLPGNLSVTLEDYNGVDDPSSLIGCSRDVFEAYRKAQYVKLRENAEAAKAADASFAANE